jgi:hypothetical protein
VYAFGVVEAASFRELEDFMHNIFPQQSGKVLRMQI